MRLLVVGCWLLVQGSGISHAGRSAPAFQPTSDIRQPTTAFLRAALEADERLSYRGARVVRAVHRGEEREQRVRVSHLAPDRTRIDYVGPESGDVLLESGTGRWFYSRRREQWRSIEWRPRRSHVRLLLRNYRVRPEGEGTVAGRRVAQFVIEPRHPGNPSKRVWIDPATRMILKEEVRDWQGRLIAASAFEQFEVVRDLPQRLFEPPATAESRPPPAALPFTPVRPRYLPPGYREVHQGAMHRGPGPGVHLRYTDGLGTFSLFQSRHDGRDRRAERRARPEGERPRRGADRREARPELDRQVGELRLRLMGDISPEELRKVLDSLPDRS